MGFLRRVAQGGEQRDFTLKQYSDHIAALFGEGPTFSGESVSVEGSLALIPVYAAINVIASSIGVMPCHVYRRLDRGRERATDTWQYRLLHESPNDEMAPGQFFETLIVHLLGWGDCFSEKVKGSFAGAPRVVELYPIQPKRVHVDRRKSDGAKVFEIEGHPRSLTEKEILHIPGLGYDGTCGMSPIAKAREEIAGAMARQKFQGKFYGKGALLAGVIERPRDAPKWSTEAQSRFKATWGARYEGPNNAGGTPVLEDGMQFKPASMPMRDQQFIEQGQFTVTQIATLFNMPASRINGSTGDSLTYGNRESDQLAFVQTTLLPWMNRLSQGLWRDNDLFPSRTFYPDFLPEALLKGDHQARAEFYKAMNDLKVLSANDIAELEDRPVRPGGDEFPEPPKPAQPGGDAGDDQTG